MELKKKLRAFFTLTRKGNGGFTLVELIVTIAILGILAGVGTVGYSGYVKSAQKKADQTLVSNIIRAIEVGTNSTMFVNDDSFKMGQMAYPIGFITLTASESTDSQVVTSKTEMTGPVEGNCVFETATVTRLTSENVSQTCWFETKTERVYTITNEEIRYCTVHGSAPSALSSDTEYVTAFTGCNHGWSHDWKITKTTLPAGTLSADSSVKVASTKNSSLCERAYNYQYGSFTGTTDIGAAVSGDTLYDAIEAAFGDVESLKLQYDGWTSDEGVDYATFYTAAPAVMEDVESLSGLLILGQNLVGADRLGLSTTYNSGEEVLVNVAKLVVETYPTEDAWMEKWNIACDQLWDGWGFDLPGRETYCAARVGYNTAFASYMDANGLSQYSEKIRDFQSQSIAGVGLPALVCTDAFNDSDARSKLGLSDAAIEEVAALYAKYKDSAACEENGRVFYRTLATFNETADIAQAQVADGKYTDIYGYYNSYVNEIAAMYDAAQTAAGDGIVIIVTVEGGEVKCDVSPVSADLRNK